MPGDARLPAAGPMVCPAAFWHWLRRTIISVSIVSWAGVAAAQGDLVEPWCDYRTPAGVVYEGETLTPEQARELPGRNAVLTLLNVKAISAEVAGIIVSPHEPKFLTLPALETDDVGVAAALSFHRGHLRLFGMKRLTPEVAAALVGSPGQSLEIPDVREVSPEAARALADGTRGKVVVGLTSLSIEIAEILAKFKGSLCFPQKNGKNGKERKKRTEKDRHKKRTEKRTEKDRHNP